MLPQYISAIVSAAVSISLFIFTKLFDPLSDYLGLANPVDRQRRLDDHRHSVEKVTAMRDAFLRNDAYPYSQPAQRWFKCVKDLESDKETLHAEYEEAGRNIFKKWRCARQASKEQKRADDLALQFKDLCQEPKMRPRPVQRVELDGLLRLEPYMSTLFQFINSTESSLLGVWGMGGVGKSTLLRSIATSRSNYAASDECFEILFVHAGRDCTVAKLQRAVSELLGLSVTTTEECQAVAISFYLSDKNFLLLLDDMWEAIDLELIGIPQPPTTPGVRQKVILTSRLQILCAAMNCGQHIIHMVCPNEEVALKFFSNAVGPSVMKDARIHPLAKMIVEECGCLPEVLQKIGRVMSLKHGIDEWEYTIELLRESKLSAITHKNEDLLDRLKWSYDGLEDSLKPCFLVCSLWREGECIPTDKLIRWWTGMGVLNGPDAHKNGAYNVKALLDSSLLEKGDNGLCTAEGSHVRMHDMVRKMAMQIVKDSEEQWACDSSCRPALTEAKWYKVQKAWVSAKDIELLVRRKNIESNNDLYSKKLTMLVTRHSFDFQPIGLFENMVFLDMEGSKCQTFPLQICSMRNLQYLNLSSTQIDALPLEFSKLSKLKYLYIRDNAALQAIPEEAICTLEHLEEFDLFCTSSMQISSLLKALDNPAVGLSMIGFTVQTESEVQELARLGQVHAVSVCFHQFHDDFIDLQLLSEMQKCREVCIVDSPNVKMVVAEGAQEILPYLQSFEISNMPNLATVTFRSTGLSLTTVNVSYCEKLTDLTCISELINLEQLTVTFCEKIEILVPIVLRRNLFSISLPKLKKIHLQGLPQLHSLCNLQLRLDNITHFCVVGCEKLIRVPVQHHNLNKIILECDAAWWKEVVAVTENHDMEEHFTTNPWM